MNNIFFSGPSSKKSTGKSYRQAINFNYLFRNVFINTQVLEFITGIYQKGSHGSLMSRACLGKSAGKNKAATFRLFRNGFYCDSRAHNVRKV